MNHNHLHKRACHRAVMFHDVVCRHQIEVEVWPAAAEVYFLDEGFENIINSQVRFDAAVLNAPSARLSWAVIDIDGGPGAGIIDQAGLYTAPQKGSHKHGTTDIVVVTSDDDPLRKAYAKVTLVGRGPAKVPEPSIEIFPRQVTLYYPEGANNDFIDESNTMQLFRAHIRHSPLGQVTWKIGSTTVSSPDPWYLYKVSSGSPELVTITAYLDGTSASNEARVVVLNYEWPGYVSI